MEGIITRFINEFRSSSDNSSHETHRYLPSHTGLVIPVDRIQSFWTRYCEGVDSLPEVPGYALGEVMRMVGPLVVDLTFTFRHYEDDHEDLVPSSTIIRLIHTYQEVIIEKCILPDPGGTLVVIVLQSRRPGHHDHLVTMQYRFLFPYLRCSFDLQQAIRETVITRIQRTNLMASFPHAPEEGWQVIIGKYQNDQLFPIYPFSSNHTLPLMMIDRGYGMITKVNDKYTSTPIDLESILDFSHHRLTVDGTVDSSLESTQSFNHWLPYLLSPHYGTLITKSKLSATPTYTGESDNDLEEITYSIEPVDPCLRYQLEDPWTIIGQVIMNIGTYHFYGYDDWITTMSIINNSDGTNTGRDYWTKICHSVYQLNGCCPKFIRDYGKRYDTVFSSLDDDSNSSSISLSSGKYDMYDSEQDYPRLVALVERLWRAVIKKDNHLTYRTLLWWLAKDNPSFFEKWRVHRHHYYLRNCLKADARDINEHDLALHFAELYGLWFVNVGRNAWWYFREGAWVEDDGGEIRRTITNKFIREYEMEQARTAELIPNIFETEDKELMQSYLNQVGRVIMYVKKNTHHMSLYNYLSHVLHDGSFGTKLDRNVNITGVANGVFRSQGSKIVFDEGRPEDFIYKRIDTVFDRSLSWEDTVVQEVLTWFEQVFDTPDLINYVYRLFASLLFKSGNKKIIPFFTGNGNNSKSKIINLLEMIFGMLLVKIPVSSLTQQGRRNASAPTPELAQCAGAHVVVADEPDEGAELEKHVLKLLGSGGDTFFARLLHKNGGKVKANFITILVCNVIPRIKDPDDATKERVVIIPFDSKWVKPEEAPAPSLQRSERRYPIDYDFESRIPMYAPAALWILFQKFSDYKLNGLVQPEIVKQRIEQYWSESDVFTIYITSRLITVDDPTVTIGKDEIITDFRHWFVRAYPGGNRPPSSFKLESRLVKLWGEPVNERWSGHSFCALENAPVHRPPPPGFPPPAHPGFLPSAHPGRGLPGPMSPLTLVN